MLKHALELKRRQTKHGYPASYGNELQGVLDTLVDELDIDDDDAPQLVLAETVPTVPLQEVAGDGVPLQANGHADFDAMDLHSLFPGDEPNDEKYDE